MRYNAPRWPVEAQTPSLWGIYQEAIIEQLGGIPGRPTVNLLTGSLVQAGCNQSRAVISSGIESALEVLSRVVILLAGPNVFAILTLESSLNECYVALSREELLTYG